MTSIVLTIPTAAETSKMTQEMSLLELMDETVENSKLFFENKFDECLEKFKARADESMYHYFGQCLLQSIQALLTFDKKIMATAIGDIEACLVVYGKKYRKQSSGIFSHKNYDDYSDAEIHAELSYNILLNLSSLLSVIYDQSFTGFVKSAYRITTAYLGYKECLRILETRQCWSHPRVRDHFEALLKHFFGIIEIVIAYMPPKLSRLLEFIGFSGSLDAGMQYLETSFSIKNTFGNFASAVVIMFLNVFAEFFYGLGHINLRIMNEIHNDCMLNFPDSVFATLSKATVLTADSRFDEVVNIIDEFTENNEPQPQYIIYVMTWLKSWSYAFLCDWNNAQKSMRQMLDCPWAPAMFHYICGTFMFSDKNGEDSTTIDSEVSEIFEKVPSLRMKIGGRKLFHDDFVVNRCKKYFSDSRNNILPTYELFYIWNYFSLISKNEKSVETILRDIKTKIDALEDTNAHYDDYSVLLFLKAVVLKHSQQEDEAKKIFLQIIQDGKKMKQESFVVPHSMYEIALISKENGNMADAKDWIKKTKKYHHEYVTERLLHFRCDLLLDQFKNKDNNRNNNVEFD